MANHRMLLAAATFVGPALHAGIQQSPTKIPSDWVEISSGIYELRNPGQTRERAEAILAAGHQPWRLQPANIASECLQAFGVEGPQDLATFAAMLHPLRTKPAFQLHKPGFIYTVYIDNQSKVPIAIKLVVSKR